MDLVALLSNEPLVAALTHEYEQLRTSGGG